MSSTTVQPAPSLQPAPSVQPAPTRRPASSTKTVIVDAAVENFQSRGYHGTSIRDIARGADMTPASIYHHFASKQQILQHIMEQVLKQAISDTNSALMMVGRSPEDQLVAVVTAWVLYHTEHRALALIGASEIRSLDDVGLRIVVSLRDQQQQIFQGVIARGVAEGAFTTPYPTQAAMAIINMGSSISSWYRADGELTADELAQRYAALALGTVGAHRTRLSKGTER
ncbi:TetR/AcrR family transcriptional regulator [Rhodococcoides yunnanense]|uniref:TetR/AcrR family transcriptional regulator n=1 Tax=Rhodococcoides yunnanense TaxID=278209 RepID=UPI000A01DF01|nr:TetR/AcrR family transcriptional regulator [Rhodococcus yunnanensis]